MSYRRDGQFRNARQDRILRQQNSLNQTLDQHDLELADRIDDVEFDLPQYRRPELVIQGLIELVEALEERVDFEAKDGWHIR